ncbi:MAG: 30S ribosomal protein S9 [Gammaproteobacteria bacterium]|nr:30S ribosomal protein S9 [Gammaproteobacteria bacterium]
MSNLEKNRFYGTGRRKTSVARVYLRPGNGVILVNKKPIDEYFGRETSRMVIRQPLVATTALDKFDIFATVYGGGSSGQAGAIRLGIARALVEHEKEITAGADTTTKRTLRTSGYLTRDSRVVERKKVGRHKARRGTQYSKR